MEVNPLSVVCKYFFTVYWFYCLLKASFEILLRVPLVFCFCILTVSPQIHHYSRYSKVYFLSSTFISFDQNFNPFWINFYVWSSRWDLNFFAHGYPYFPALCIETATFPPLSGCNSFIKDYLYIFLWIYLWAFKSCFLIPVP